MRSRNILAAAFAAVLGSTSFAGTPALFSVSDPRGDDHGYGSLRYPLRDDLRPGDLDVVSFAAFAEKEGTRFEVVFANRIRRPDRRAIDIGGGNLDAVARFGFYTFNLDVYVDTDRKPASGATNTLPGRVAEIAPESAWEKCVALTPRPFEAKEALRRYMVREVRRDKKAEGNRLTEAEVAKLGAEAGSDIEARIFFPTVISVRGPKITFFVPGSFLGGPASADWAYTIVVTGSDIEQKFDVPSAVGAAGFRGDNLMVIPLALSPSRESFGGGREDEMDFMPPIVDTIVPAGASQETILDGYDIKAAKKVQLPGVVPSAVSAPR